MGVSFIGMSEREVARHPELGIKKVGKGYLLFINGKAMETVESFSLSVNAGEVAKLTVTMDVL